MAHTLAPFQYRMGGSAVIMVACILSAERSMTTPRASRSRAISARRAAMRSASVVATHAGYMGEVASV